MERGDPFFDSVFSLGSLDKLFLGAKSNTGTPGCCQPDQLQQC